jgi:hypothetical protein
MADTPTQAVIFFVGLALWTTTRGSDVNVNSTARLSNEPQINERVQVVTPILHYNWKNSASTERMTASAHTDMQLVADQWGNVQHVEDHIPLLITYTGSFDNPTGWTLQQLGDQSSPFSYVRLDQASNVTFSTGGASNSPLSIRQALLPRVQGGRTPNASDAVVFDLPEGSMQPCLSRTKAEKPRLDGRLELTTKGNEIVVNVKSGANERTLHIKRRTGDRRIVLMVANIPERYLQGNYKEHSENALEQMPHIQAYYALTNATCTNCAQDLKQWFLDNMEKMQPCDSDITGLMKQSSSCPRPPDISTLVAAAAQNPSTFSGVMQGANFMCSNEGWP